jgi:hypothetical protein
MEERRSEIELYGKKYPNVPMEAILKNDLLRLGLLATLRLRPVRAVVLDPIDYLPVIKINAH